MGRIFLFISLAVIFFAGSFAAAADKVVVVPLSSTKTIVDPNNIVSFYTTLTATEEKTVFTVPADKKFMLTDIVGNGNVVVKENTSIVVYAFLHDLVSSSSRTEQAINFSAGIPFASGSELRLGEFDSQPAQITISGYYFK